MGGREEAVRRHDREVLGHLRRFLAVGEPVTPLGSPYRLVTEEVRLEERKGEETAVVRFRLAGDERAFGFRVELSEVGDPSFEDPIITYETILALLDEAVLVGPRSASDAEGIVWVGWSRRLPRSLLAELPRTLYARSSENPPSRTYGE